MFAYFRPVVFRLQNSADNVIAMILLFIIVAATNNSVNWFLKIHME